jgi:carboxyl-terminal processing protease
MAALTESLMSKKKIAFLSISVALMLSLIGGALFGQAASQKNNVYRYLSIFTEVFDLVRNNYVEAVPSDQLLDGAFNGVTDAVDEFSYYVPPSQMAAYKNFTDVEDNGIGLIVTKRFGYGYVIAPVANSPAAKAGVERGDFIEKIDGQPTQRMAVWQIRTALNASHPVKIQVLRGGQTKRDDFTIQQTHFHPIGVTTKQYNGVTYVALPFFEKGTAEQFRAALQNVRKSGTRKLIVDVRGNAGGDVNEAIASADALLSSGVITSLEGRRIEPRRWTADRNTDYDGEVEVLTDSSTAAGGEIFAAAIHGNNRGKVVGVTTYGKSIVQQLIKLESGGAVFMTIGHYTTPELKPIKEGGVKPDVIVDLTAQALRDPNAKNDDTPSKPQEDLILEKALQLFNAPATVYKNAA